MPVLLCAGFGYSAEALARLLRVEGWRVIGTHRRPEGAAAIRAAGAEPSPWPPAPETAATATHLLVSAAPDAEGDPTLRALGPLLKAPPLEWVGYLSTTGVYGDHAGGWVDETAPLTPATERGRARVRAEAAWRATGLPVRIFRLAGIYGPGRGPFEKVRSGEARRIVKPGQVFSRIHRDDIAAALRASIARPEAEGPFNLCDDEPAPPEDVIGHAAALLGLPPPPLVPFETAELSPMARSFYAESKRVSNARTKAALGLRLRFPGYREGLAAVLAEETALAGSAGFAPAAPAHK